jgi:hypothetical protein
MDEQTLKRVLNEVLEPVLEPIRKDLAEVKDTLETRMLPSVTETENTLKSYADSYKINRDNIERLDTRVTTVEDNLNIDPPEELKVPHFS